MTANQLVLLVAAYRGSLTRQLAEGVGTNERDLTMLKKNGLLMEDNTITAEGSDKVAAVLVVLS